MDSSNSDAAASVAASKQDEKQPGHIDQEKQNEKEETSEQTQEVEEEEEEEDDDDISCGIFLFSFWVVHAVAFFFYEDWHHFCGHDVMWWVPRRWASGHPEKPCTAGVRPSKQWFLKQTPNMSSSLHF